MLEKDSWSQTPGIFDSCGGDSSKEAKRVTSDETPMSDHCFKSSNLDSGGCVLCADDTILVKCVVEDDSVCQYPINHISEADNELSFLDNDGWLDIGNFEDVDKMLSCDLTFGTESLNNDQEFCWLSSSHGAEDSDDALKSDFKFPFAEMSPLKSISDYNMDSKENIVGLPINDSNKRPSHFDEKIRCQLDIIDDGVPDPLSTFSESELDMKSGSIVDLLPKEKRKLPKSSAGRQKNRFPENGGSAHPYTLPEQYAHTKPSFGSSSSGVTSLDSIQKHKLNIDSDSLGCMQTPIPITRPGYSHAPSHTALFLTLSGSRSEHDGHLSPSLIESSYTSTMESSRGPSLEAAALKTNEFRENLYHCCDRTLSSSSFKNANIPSQIPFCSLGSAQRVGNLFENENEGHSDEVQGVSLGFSPEIDSSTVQESSSIGSALDQTSLQATSFCHLQQIMDQLDIRTKLCIRDSLYRLAKSAEQRHNSNANGCIGDNETCKTMIVQDASRCTGLMDVEADTNPIDRSVAHLLFHRPSDPLMLLPNETLPFKSSATMHHGSLISPPVKTEKQVCQEDSSTGVEKKFLGANT